MKNNFFIAIEPPEKIKKRFSSLKINLPVRWTPKENIHLTLFFIGRLDEKLVQEIRGALEAVVENVKRFSLKIDGFSYFPHKTHPPKMIWATITDSKSLKELRKRVCEALRRENIKFIPHITLARINSWKFKQLDNEEIPDLPGESVSFKVSSICLMESKIIKGKVKYQLIEKFDLK